MSVSCETVIHLGQPLPIASCTSPERTDVGFADLRIHHFRCFSHNSPFCLGLLRMGLAEPRMLPLVRCALTAPFHPYRLWRRYIFCGAIPRVTPDGRYPSSLSLWSPDFPPSSITTRATVRPPDLFQLEAIGCKVKTKIAHHFAASFCLSFALS